MMSSKILYSKINPMELSLVIQLLYNFVNISFNLKIFCPTRSFLSIEYTFTNKIFEFYEITLEALEEKIN